MYLDDEELDRNFSWLASSQITRMRMHVYFYEIAHCGGVHHKKPFLKTYVCSVGVDPAAAASEKKYVFPTIDVDFSPPPSGVGAAEAEAGEKAPSSDPNDEILNQCLEKLSAEIIQSGEYIANYRNHYKGFVKLRPPFGIEDAEEEIALVFQIPEGQSKTIFMETRGLVPAILDEIMNRRKIYDIAVDELVQRFFYTKPRLLYLTSPDFENLEIPQIMFLDAAAPERRTEGEMGFFFYFSAAAAAAATDATAQRYAAFVENDVYYSLPPSETAVANDENREFNAAAISFDKTQKWALKCPEFFVKLE